MKGPVSQEAGPSSESESPSLPFAWQPFTPHGLAAFGKTTFGRLLLVLWTTALICAATMVWFLNEAWFPAIRAAIHQLPEQGEISGRELNIPRASLRPLAEQRFLGFVVLVSNETGGDLSSDVAVKFRKRNVDVCSIFGCSHFNYPSGWIIEFNRADLEPRWGAWEPIVSAIAAVVTLLGLITLWVVLGLIYCFIPWIVAVSKKRDLTFAGSWLMCSAALVPGALLFVVAIWGYGLRVLDLLQFLVLAVVHIVVAWVCILFAFRVLPPRPPRPANPFALTSANGSAPAGSKAKTEISPFNPGQ